MTIAPTHKAFADYAARLASYAAHGATNEGAVSHAFWGLLEAFVEARPGWALLGEQTMGKIRLDGVVRNNNFLPHGFWEAKDTADDLEKEITKKIAKGYPRSNTIFEDTRRAVLYQNGQRDYEADLTKPAQIAELLTRFFDFQKPDPQKYQDAVREFKESIPVIAGGLQELIAAQRERNIQFNAAFDSFRTLCRASIDPNITDAALDEMLIQHLLTERIFRTVFNNPEFTRRNVIAAEVERVVAQLTSSTFSRDEFLKSLGRYFVHIEDEARQITDWGAKQALLNDVYERFFQGYSTRQADTHGIVYTPQEIVDFMCRSVAHVLHTEFGKGFGDPDVVVLDPATGTGNFIVNLIKHHIPASKLPETYRHRLFANEIMLLPYYIASLNIERAYFERHGDSYEAFEGLCFVDTLDMAQAQQLGLFVKENTSRVQAEKDAPINVIIGNPPYNLGQKNENDNNKNRRYEVVDKRISQTYAKDSKASNKNKLSDAYVKFFRWASDRLEGRDGVVCLVTNNSFMDQTAFDGMRKHLLQDFTRIWHLDLHGNVRQNAKLSGSTHNVFGIQVGVGITLAVRKATHANHGLYYHRVPENWRREEKLAFLGKSQHLVGVASHALQPNTRHVWRTDGMDANYEAFPPLGTKEGKSARTVEPETLFRSYSQGVLTARDEWMYGFDAKRLAEKAGRMVKAYNEEVSRWVQAGCPQDIDRFVVSDGAQIKWSSKLKDLLRRTKYADFSESRLRNSLYRPFVRQFLYFDSVMTHRQGQFTRIFPTTRSENENTVIIAGGYGRKDFAAFVSNYVPDFNFYADPAQCFPLYTYNEDGTGKRENITDWALGQFRARYGDAVTKRDIFHAVYALLHHPTYREKYAENLRRELPRVPFVAAGAWAAFVAAGEALAALHLGYESAPEFTLDKIETPGATYRDIFHVHKMKYADKERTAVVVNPALTLSGVPAAAHAYRLGNRSALDWILDQYQIKTDARSGITSDPNRPDDPEYIVRLIGQVVHVSVETVRAVAGLPELASS